MIIVDVSELVSGGLGFIGFLIMLFGAGYVLSHCGIYIVCGFFIITFLLILFGLINISKFLYKKCPKIISLPIISVFIFGLIYFVLCITSYSGNDPFRKYELVTIVNTSSVETVNTIYYRKYDLDNENRWNAIVSKQYLSNRTNIKPKESKTVLLQPGKYEIKITTTKNNDYYTVYLGDDYFEINKTPLIKLLQLKQNRTANLCYAGKTLFVADDDISIYKNDNKYNDIPNKNNVKSVKELLKN